MKRHRLTITLCLIGGLLLAGLIVTFTRYRSQHERLHELELHRLRFCRRMRTELVTIVENGIVYDLQTRIEQQRDPELTNLCLGREVPDVGSSEADTCWILTFRDECFLPVAKKLLELHRGAGYDERLRELL
jgi:hypothetical protein